MARTPTDVDTRPQEGTATELVREAYTFLCRFEIERARAWHKGLGLPPVFPRDWYTRAEALLLED